ncbi:GNAT family N-acetyltransferase [Chryseobacterium vaccae]|uniref:GNAT family N-acetyltransferase n=1 Tax=Chryseobacterium vaccae TaxID=2604424 RepID=UPI001297EE7F|nr:GNAT family N-acetyltransferase [Chryseobacterium vaccae]
MTKEQKYIFTSTRLGFRNWEEKDVEELYKINSDSRVMEFFPTLLTKNQTIEFIEKMKIQFKKNGFCYFAVEKLENKEFIGFIGLSEQNYEADFTQCIDIGWRIKCNEWNQGFATEGAKRCLEYAEKNLNIDKVYSIAPKINIKSEAVMKKIGLEKVKEFEHPLLRDDERLKTCILYQSK